MNHLLETSTTPPPSASGKSKNPLIRHYKGGLPGFHVTMGFTLLYLGLIVILPLTSVFITSFESGPAVFWDAIFTPRVLASLKLSFFTSFIAALVNACTGTLFAWVLVRYSFPGRRILDAAMDLPFALPTAVAGIALTAIYARHGWVGSLFTPFGIKIAYAPAGIILALIFVGIPFVVRTVQPLIEKLEPEIEEASAVLGASRLITISRVILPTLLPAILTGFALSFARGLGEYGSVVFISGNMPLRTEIAPLLIITKLEQYDYTGATALAVTMLVISFVCLLSINLLQRWTARRAGQNY